MGSFYVYSRLNNEVQKYVLAELKERYPQLDIQVGNAQIVDNRGITVKDIKFSVPNRSGQPQKLLYIGELFIDCPITLQSLYQKSPRINRITVKEPILRASRAADGTFAELQLLAGTGDSLFLFPEGGKPIPVEVENGMLLYDNALQPAAVPPLRLTGINFTVTPDIADQTQRLHIKGGADSDFFRRLDIEALFLPETKQWQFTANCRQFDWSDDLWYCLPPHPYNKPRPHFQGRFTDFRVSAISDSAADWGFRFAVSGTLAHGRLDLPHINRAFTELSTRFEITSEKIVIDKLTGNSDYARFAASYVQDGLIFSGDPRQQAELTLNVRDLRFDEELVEILSPFLNDTTEELLARFDYGGTTDLHAQLSCRNGKWHPKSLSMQISDVGFAFRAFPYRLDRLAGNLYVDETASLHFHFQSKQDAPLKVGIDGRYGNIFVDPAGKVEVTGENVPIDPKLLRSLPPSVQNVVDSLHPVGKLNARLVFELPPGDVPLSKHFDIMLDHVSLRYDHFPYPLRDVTGWLQYDGNIWQFRDIRGANGTAVVKGSGYLRPVGSVYGDAQEFVLHVAAEDLPIDDQIAQALIKPDQQKLLQSLNINGKVNLAAQIHYRTDEKQLNLHFQAVPRAGLSLCTDRFPYKIENVAGEIRYENGHVIAETLTGTHRNTQLRSGLDCRFTADGQSVLLLERLTIDQLQADRELLDALPKHLRDFLETVQITKPFNLSGGVEYRLSTQGEQTARWDLNWTLHQKSAKLGFPVDNIFGIVRLVGQSAGDQVRLSGELNLDSLMAYGFQVTSVCGPFFYNGKYLQLGVPADPRSPQIVPRPLTGQTCDGTIRAEGLVVLENGFSYTLIADLIGADLAKVAQTIEPAAQKTSGTLNCTNIALRGIGTNLETVGGSGTIQLRNANIYGAPVMVRLLRELRIKESDPNAGMFSSMDVDFRLSGMDMFLNSVIFEGGVISLHGNGKIRLDNRQVDLTMRTLLGNRRTQIPILTDLIGGVGAQLVQLKVTGPLSDPAVTRVALPEIQGALQQIQGDDVLPQPSDSRNPLAPSKMFQWNPL